MGAFARKPFSNILPTNEPFIVNAINGSFLLLSYVIEGGDVYTYNNHNGSGSIAGKESIGISQLQDNTHMMSTSSSTSHDFPQNRDGKESYSTTSTSGTLTD